jgi:hypothetical protein
MTLIAPVLLACAAVEKPSATPSGVKQKRWVIKGITSTRPLESKLRLKGYVLAYLSDLKQRPGKAISCHEVVNMDREHTDPPCNRPTDSNNMNFNCKAACDI